MDRWPKRGGAKRPESSSGTSSPLTSGSENLFATFRQPNYNPQTRAILTAMRPVEARYEDGVLKPEDAVDAELDARFRAAYDANGVDRSLIRWNLTQTPTERVRAVEETLNALATVRRIEPPR